MQVFENVLEMVGQTPLLALNNLDTGPCRLFLKMELMNPGGSIKDRIAISMIDQAERRGDLKPGDTIVEATAGNTGIGLALVAARKGYRLILVLPDKMSREKVYNLRAMGAKVVMTRSDVEKGHPEYYQEVGRRIAQETGGYFINQFGNADNPKAHAKTTAPEIWQQMDHRIDAIVLGVGSSGTITGLSRFFRKTAPDLTMVLADPKGSILAEYVETGRIPSSAGSWRVEGIGEDFLPPISDLSFTTKAYSIDDKESFAAARELLKKEGVLAGSSTGTCLAAALKYCREQTEPQRVVTFACDTGSRYLSKFFNDGWLAEEGLTDRPPIGDLRDLILCRLDEPAFEWVGPDDSLATAHNRMKNSGSAQIPVMDKGVLVGILSEKDIIRFVYGHPERSDTLVAAAMQSAPPTVDKSTSMDELADRLQTGAFVAVMDGEQFLGMITRSDMINYLRVRAKM